jgi:hypothetical protein
MSTIKQYVRSTRVIATLAAALLLSAAIDAASAKDQAREGSAAASSAARAESPSMLAEKPVEPGTKPFRNTIHPIIDKPDHGGKHHGGKHDGEHGNDHGHQTVYECFAAPCPQPVPRRGWLTKPAYLTIRSAPKPADAAAEGATTVGSKPILTGPGYGVSPARGISEDVSSASSAKTEQ